MRRHFESTRFQSGVPKVGACGGQSVANWDGTSDKWIHTVHRSGHRTPNLGILVIYGAGGCQQLNCLGALRTPDSRGACEAWTIGSYINLGDRASPTQGVSVALPTSSKDRPIRAKPSC